MDYQVYMPSKNLSEYVKLYWTLEGEASNPPAKERVFPDGCIELIFHYGSLFKKYNIDDDVIQPRIFFHGQLKKYIEIEATGKIGMFSVRFHPHGLKPFVDFNIDTITDSIVDINDVWGAAGEDLGKRMIVAASNDERIKIIEQFLLDELSDTSKYDVIAASVKQIEQVSGMISIDQLASDAFLGRRHFERKFSETVGLTPKFFARIIRFNYVLKLIEKKEWNNLAQLAQDGGFYDQAHFIKDFKDFTGLNPKSYFAEDLELVKFFNL